MDASIAQEIARLRTTTIKQVQARFKEVFGHQTHSTHRDHLVRRIAWKLQALAHGDVSGQALQHALAIADESDLDGTGRNRPKRADPRLPPPGVELTREYRGKLVAVKVLQKGFEYEGQPYGSLSAVARAVTGTPWNGLVFFGLIKRGETKRRRKPAGNRRVSHAA